MSDIIDFTDDVIVPDDFDPTAETYDLESETPASPSPTTSSETENADGLADAQPAEPTITPEPEASPQPELPAAPQSIKVKYNHEEREIGLEEAALLAQKGMNYDKLEARLKALEANDSRSARLAKHLGYENVEEMFAAAEENFVKRQIQELVDEGNTEAMARFLVQQRMAEAAKTEAAQVPEPSQGEPTPKPDPSGLTPERKAELDEFVKAYPGITKLPDEVIAANRNGVRLLVAYERYQNKAALDELAILKQNQAAAAKAPVSGVTGKSAQSSTSEADDAFLKGFNSDAW